MENEKPPPKANSASGFEQNPPPGSEYAPRPDQQIVSLDDENADPVAQLFNSILRQAIRESASDIHLEPTKFGVEVRLRVDGVLRLVFEVPRPLRTQFLSWVKTISGMNINGHQTAWGGRLRAESGGNQIDLRTSVTSVPFGEKIVLHLLRADPSLFHFSQLGMPLEIEQAILRALEQKGKLLFVAGPVGSGRTTTLYACLNHLKWASRAIQTIEAPIEYQIDGITQTEFKPGADQTVGGVFRSILQLNPDVILLSEVTDSETADIAIRAAASGRLILSALDAFDTISAVDRLKSWGLEPPAIAANIAGILAQRLVRRICPACRTPVSTEYLLHNRQLTESIGLDISAIRAGSGCEDCHYTGYRGRIGIFSYLEITQALEDLLRANASMPKFLEQAHSSGFISLENASIKLVEAGETTLDEVRPYLTERKDQRHSEIMALAAIKE